jgi:hypothetical protein
LRDLKSAHALVIPAKAGIQGNRTEFRAALDPGFRRDDAI